MLRFMETAGCPQVTDREQDIAATGSCPALSSMMALAVVMPEEKSSNTF
jgi:hypothetical protein